MDVASSTATEGVPRSQRRAYMACATVLTAAATCSVALACALSCCVMRDGSGNDIERVTSCMLCFASALQCTRLVSLASRRTQPHLVKSILEYVILAGSLQRPYISTAYVAVYRNPYASWRAREPNRHQHDRMTEAAHARNIGRHLMSRYCCIHRSVACACLCIEAEGFKFSSPAAGSFATSCML